VRPVLHGDNGATLKATTVLAMLHWLGIEPSYSRPRVSDDNAFAEALFRKPRRVTLCAGGVGDCPCGHFEDWHPPTPGRRRRRTPRQYWSRCHHGIVMGVTLTCISVCLSPR
jgi:transposase InsO family protein